MNENGSISFFFIFFQFFEFFNFDIYVDYYN